MTFFRLVWKLQQKTQSVHKPMQPIGGTVPFLMKPLHPRAALRTAVHLRAAGVWLT